MRAAPIVLLHTDAPDLAQGIVAAAHPDVEIHACPTYADLPDALARTGAEVVYSVRFAGTPTFPRDALLGSPNVKWVSVGGSGTDHLGAWDPRHVTVTNAAGIAADAMADYALGAMLAFSLDWRAFQRAQEARRWHKRPIVPLTGRTVLILGFGRTGQAVARRAKAFGMAVLGVRASPVPHPDADEIHSVKALPCLWPRADVVVVCVPLLPGTRGLVDARAFAALPPGAVLVDVSRGGVVDEAALLAALRDGRLKGAALDVFETEPLPDDHPLWALDNVIVTPHNSSIFDGWERAALDRFAANLGRYRRGGSLFDVVDPMRGY